MRSLHNQLALAGGTAHTTPILLIASTPSPISCWAAILQPLGQECAGPTAPSGSVHLALSPPQDIPCRSLLGWLLLLFQVSTQLSPLWEASLTSLCPSLPLPSIALLRFIFFIQLAMIWHYSDPLTYLSSTCPTADQFPEHRASSVSASSPHSPGQHQVLCGTPTELAKQHKWLEYKTSYREGGQRTCTPAWEQRKISRKWALSWLSHGRGKSNRILEKRSHVTDQKHLWE